MKELLSLLAVLLFPTLFMAQDCIKGNCQNGYGTCVYPGGAKYIGDFKDGKIHGKGIFYYQNGDKYIGNWSNQQREGTGRLVFTNKDEYFGEFSNDVMGPTGKMTYANGNIYEGQWKKNEPHGKGVFLFANQDRYEGLLSNGQCEGQGTMYYSDGSSFKGEWHHNKRHGQGLMTFDDGERVSGQWEDDQYVADWGRLAYDGDTTYLRNCNQLHCADGKGKFTYNDGSKYVGDFKAGVPEGMGTTYYVAGDRYEGGWKQNAPHGKGVMYYVNGKSVGAIWDFGRPVKKLFVKNEQVNQGPISVDQNKEVKIWAVIIGAARYAHMPALRYTDDDAYQIYAFLKSPEGGALPDNQLKLLIDEDATRGNILQAMRGVFLRADENDVIMFYFSGHGLQGSFLPVDYDGYNNLLKHEEINNLLRASKAKHKLVIADACHSGSILAAKTTVQTALQKYYAAFEDTQGGTALMMSSKGEEYSLEDGGLRSGIFSHFLVRGLKGEADRDRDSIVTVEELFNFVYQNVRSYTGNVQTPTLTGKFDQLMPVAVIR